ncbi:MAG: haloacid dehalogenase type II [Acidobacteriia bacterium]|nr:haloacid dehalogenase type II [Terriglobia bacterium]
MPDLDFSQFSWLTFDCYGTLIDWDRGILSTLRPILAAHGRNLSDAGILELFAAIERVEEAGEYRPYRQILESVMTKMAARLVFRISGEEVRSLPDSLGDWAPFPDTVAALRQLKQRYRLAVISNTDDDLFARTATHLETPFDAVITAQQARSYKPSLNNFRIALERLGVRREKVLHVAQSLYHDIAPANELGIASVWVNRNERAGASGGAAGAAKPDLIVPDMATLAAMASR